MKRTLKLATCTVLAWILGIQLLHAQNIQLHSVASASHTNASNGTVSLTGSFGQPIISSGSSSALTSGFYSAATSLLTTNLVPKIVINDFDFTVTNPVLSAEIEDLDGIENATLWIKPIGTSDFTQVTLSDPIDDVFSYTINTEDFDDMGLEYYFEASDLTGLMSRKPSSGSDYAYTFKSTIDLPSGLLGFGKLTEDYKMISVPYQVTPSNDVPSLLSALFDLGGTERKYDNTKWRLYSYNGLENGEHIFDEYPGSSAQNLVRGKSYWLLINNENASETIQFSNVTAPTNNQNELFSIDLQSGWNMIGNPYTTPISWENVRTYNSSVDIGALKLFTGEYANGDELQPFQGGIAYLEGADTTIEIPFAGQTPSGGRVKHETFKQDLSESNWVIDLKIEQDGRQNTLGGIGMHENASDEKDSFDDLNPPRFLSYLEMNFPHPKHTLGYFSKDIVQTQSHYKWPFSLNSFEDGPITLRWDPSGFGDNSMEIYLYDVQNQHLLDMRTSHEWTTNNNSNLEIYYGKGVLELMGPDQSFAGTPYPNPVISSSTPVIFPLILTTQVTGHQIDAAIYNKEGRLVKKLYHGELAAGLHELSWNGISDQGADASSGMYFYRINIHSGIMQKQFTGKLIISK